MTHDRDKQPKLAPLITAALGALRRQVRQYVWLDGCGAVLICLCAAFWITLAVDWFFEPSTAVRVMMLAAVAAVAGFLAVKQILLRVLVPISDSSAAAVLERRFPEFNDSLLTAVSIGGGRLDDAEIDRQMLAETCRRAEQSLSGVDMRLVFDRRPLRLKLIACGLLTLSIMLFAATHYDGFAVWGRRILALSGELWPRNTRLEVDGFSGGVRKVARGADLEVLARADATMPNVPRVVEVRYRTEDGGRGRATMDRRGVIRGPQDFYQEYAYTFRGILGDIRFDVVGGDDRVADLRIEAVDSPTVSEMTLECRWPAYIGRQPPPEPVAGVMEVPQGSNATIVARAANKELVQVQINRLVGDRPMPAATIEQDELAADRRGFSYGTGPIETDTTLLFTLTDCDDIRSRDPIRVSLVAVPDQPPQVSAQLDGIGAAVTPQARIPVTGQVTDDYGLGQVWFEYSIDDSPKTKRPIAGMAEGVESFALTGSALELSELGLSPGRKLSLCVAAADLCGLRRGPNAAEGERWSLEVVAPDQLRAMLESRELVLEQRFERMVQEMTDTRDMLEQLDLSRSDDSAAQRDTAQLLKVESALTTCRKGAQEVLSVAESFDDIRKQLVNNRIDTEELKNRLQAGIADPLRRVADAMFPELERRLEELQSVLSDADRGPVARDRARHQAEDILVEMRRALDKMIELEDFNEAVDMLRGIIKTQEELRDETQQRHKEKIRDLLKD